MSYSLRRQRWLVGSQFTIFKEFIRSAVIPEKSRAWSHLTGAPADAAPSRMHGSVHRCTHPDAGGARVRAAHRLRRSMSLRGFPTEQGPPGNADWARRRGCRLFPLFDAPRPGGGLCLIQSARDDARLALPPVPDPQKPRYAPTAGHFLIIFDSIIINDLNTIFNVVQDVCTGFRARHATPKLKKTSDTPGTWISMRRLIRAVTQTPKQTLCGCFSEGLRYISILGS